MQGMQQAEAWWYTPTSETARPEGERTQFRLRPMTQGERMEAFDGEEEIELRVVGGRQVRVARSRSWQLSYEVATRHVLEVRNAPPGLAWPGATADEAARRAFLAQLPDTEVYLIGAEVRNRSQLEAAAGN